MLSLNIKSSNYMCIDIATGNYTSFDDGLLEYYIKKKIMDVSNDSYHEHGLTMLDSFHISLGPLPTPRKSYVINDMYGDPVEIQEDIIEIEPQIIPIGSHVPNRTLNQLIGNITLSDIYISETENKKSAWIRLTDFLEIFFAILELSEIVDENPILKQLHYSNWEREYVDELHISLANLTGKRRDSIARPEDCIIDTITA